MTLHLSKYHTFRLTLIKVWHRHASLPKMPPVEYHDSPRLLVRPEIFAHAIAAVAGGNDGDLTCKAQKGSKTDAMLGVRNSGQYLSITVCDC